MSDSVECCLCGSKIVGGEGDFGQWNKHAFWCPNEKCLLFDSELSMESWRALEQLQARVKELEDMAEDYREKVINWVRKTLHKNSEKHRLEAEIADLRRRAEDVRIAISERTNRLQALRQV